MRTNLRQTVLVCVLAVAAFAGVLGASTEAGESVKTNRMKSVGPTKASSVASAFGQVTGSRSTYPDNILGYDVYYRDRKSGNQYFYDSYATYAAALRAVHYLNEDPDTWAWLVTRYRK